MSRVEVLWYVEHVARELDIACAVRHLARREHGVEVMPWSIKLDPFGSLAYPDVRVVALPWFSKPRHPIFLRAQERWPGAKFACLQFEQVFQKINEVAKAPATGFAQTHVAWSSWGDFNVDYLREHGVAETNITVNGNPSYGLYLDPYRSYFATRQEMALRYGLDPAKRWVLFPENYGAAFYIPEKLERMKQQGIAADEVDAFPRFASESLASACRWLADLAGAGVAVVLRPRPYTRLEQFMERVTAAVGKLPEGLHVIQAGSAREWILAADVVASSYSTTLIEAAVAGKPIVMARPLPFPAFVEAEWYPLVASAGSSEEFVRLCLHGGDPSSLAEWARAEMLSQGDPIRNLSDWLSGLVTPGATSVGAFSRLRTRARFEVRRWGRAMKGRERDVPETERFGPEEVERRTARWAEVLG